MRRNWFYILLSLADQNRHGSGIMRDVLDLTGGTVKLWPVALYGALDELAQQGFIKPVEGAGESARQRWFAITSKGRRALMAEEAQLQYIARVAQQRLATGGKS